MFNVITRAQSILFNHLVTEPRSVIGLFLAFGFIDSNCVQVGIHRRARYSSQPSCKRTVVSGVWR